MMTNNHLENHKEEKIAAARQKLKEFKKRNEQNQNGLGHETIESGRSSPQSVHSTHSASNKFLNLSSLNETHLNYNQVKEQLQLHVQTIGILVAEKAELQSKLQQQIKKSDKKQDECDELMGRLKVSRQKISELERLVQQLDQQTSVEPKNEDLQNQLNSKDLVIDELKIRVIELNEKLQLKSNEVEDFAKLTLDFKSQLEILQLKLNQESNSDAQETDQLAKENLELRNELKNLTDCLEKQKSELKNEYQSYVERLQKQIENLVDQINRLTDEREESFQKIDNLQSKIKSLEIELEKKLPEPIPIPQQQLADHKAELLEQEVKYFKQQIGILLNEKSSYDQLFKDKQFEIDNLNKLLSKLESDRENINTILEQSHNDKQTISRILKQNNELKDQLEELQNVYVKVTNDNLNLTTRLQSIEYKRNAEPSPEWEDEERIEKSEENGEEKQENKNETLMDSVKKRLADLEKENKDLNDYIVLSNEKLNENVNLIAELSNRIKELEAGRGVTSQLSPEYINNMKLVEEKFKKVMEENAELKEKNQELEHVIQQLQFETETIVDYITMYQMERGKLNDKYKLKDEAIRSLSTQLQVNKLALIEINNYLNAFINLYQIDNEDNRQKRDYILAQVQGLLLNLTQSSSRQLSTITIESNKNQVPAFKSNSGQTQEQLEKSMAKFRTETVICSSCYGDLFIV